VLVTLYQRGVVTFDMTVTSNRGELVHENLLSGRSAGRGNIAKGQMDTVTSSSIKTLPRGYNSRMFAQFWFHRPNITVQVDEDEAPILRCMLIN
jgi:hypothetical protein